MTSSETIRQRSTHNQHVIDDIPHVVYALSSQSEIPNDLYENNNIRRRITMSDRWQDFKISPTYKKIKSRALMYTVIIVMCTWILTVMNDCEKIDNNTFYDVNTECDRPLVTFTNSPLKMGDAVENLIFDDITSRTILRDMKTSECYLDTYRDNITCITPMAYGVRSRMISMRFDNDSIIHMLNPEITNRGNKRVRCDISIFYIELSFDQ